ncbi:MAG: sensor histidine kinase [Actinomycetota bacterium]
MFESFLAVPLHFTVEFVGFLVTAGAALLILSRPGLVPGGGFNRVTASLGFGALALAQIAHGGSFSFGEVSFELDGADLLIAIKAFGLALILIGVSGALRPREATAAVLAVDDPLLMAPVGAAALLAVMSFAASFRSGGKMMRRLALAALWLGVSSAFTAYAPDARLDVTVSDSSAVGAHGTALLGYFFLAAWLWAGVKSSIRTRFVASFVALLVVVVLVLSSALTGVITNNIEDEELRRLETQLHSSVNDIEMRDAEELLGDAASLADAPIVRSSFATPSSLEGLADQLVSPEGQDIFDFDFVFMVSHPRGSLLARAGDGPARFGEEGPRPTPLRQKMVIRIFSSQVVDEVVAPGAPALSAALDKIGNSVAVVAASEVSHPDRPRDITGVIAIGRWIDAFTLESITDIFEPARASLVVDGEVRYSTLPARITDEELVPPSVELALAAGEAASVRQSPADRAYFSAFAPLRSQGNPINVGLMLSKPAESIAGIREGVTRTLFLVALGAAAIVLFLAYVSGGRITRPIQVLTTTARSVREGNLRVRAEVGGEDEVGQLGETFNEMTAALLRQTDDLREAAREEASLRGRIETIIQSMADGLVAIDSEKKILAFNLEAEQLTGVKRDRAMGRPIESIIEVRDTQGAPISLPIFQLGEGSVSGVFLARRIGEPVPVDITCAVLQGEEGEVAGGVMVLRDMSREREIERMKSEFLSNISHELRTPLTPIKGYAEILNRRGVPAQKAKQFVTGIIDSTARLERIVGLLVDFAAMEAGRLAPRAAPVDVGSLVQSLAQEWGTRSPRHEMVVDIKSKLPKVIGDERLLRRSLEEVIDNAVKFSPDGGTITLQARGARSGNGQPHRRAVEVIVTDQGIGIPPDDIGKIFSDFHQLDGSETRTYGGLGLGLAFVQRIIEAHEGSVKVESEPERGTRLTITIPARQASGN